MSAQLLAIAKHFKTAFTKITNETFSGSEKGIGMLKDAIGDGKLLDAKPATKLDMEQRSEIHSSSLPTEDLRLTEHNQQQ
jgi:hypothetical protein